MYKNIGNKIKIVAQISAIFLSIICIIIGISYTSQNIFQALLYIILGPFFSWIASFVLYGFGTIVENLDKLANSKVLGTKNNQSKKMIKTTYSGNPLFNEKIMNYVYSTLKDISKDNIRRIKQENNNWYTEIQSLSDQDLINKINNSKDWQTEYIILCCIEIQQREKFDLL